MTFVKDKKSFLIP